MFQPRIDSKIRILQPRPENTYLLITRKENPPYTMGVISVRGRKQMKASMILSSGTALTHLVMTSSTI